MLESLQSIARRLIGPPAAALRLGFGAENDPMRHLGSLTIFFCWIVLISGIWLLIFFRTSVHGAFESVQYLMDQQRYVGGIMRSLHRYASDAAIITIFLHIVREFSRDTYRLTRWFTWIAGLPLVWMVFLLGISGYWLVWDELAQYVALTSSELIDAIPIFTDKMAANFLHEERLSDRFFTLMAFLHLIGLPIFLVFGIWLHVFKLKNPRINPPRQLMAGTLIALFVLSLVNPAPLGEKADLSVAPQVIQLDWFYLHVYPLVQVWSPAWVWVLLLAISGLIAIAPWLPPARVRRPAVVDLDNCNGCRRCEDDCPYDAITMQARTDGKRYDLEAVVDPNLCTSCGICVGACPTATPFRRKAELIPGIDLPRITASTLKNDIDTVTAEPTDVLTFACSDSDELAWLRKNGKPCIEVACIGQIPPSFLDYVLSRELSKRVLLTGCGSGCRYRFGADWSEQRITRTRDPNLRRRIGAYRISMAWLEDGNLASKLKRLERAAREDDS